MDIPLTFVCYSFESDLLCLGERQKNAIFRPSSRILRFSQITGAFRAVFGRDIFAVGTITNNPRSVFLPFTPKDRVTDAAVTPMQYEALVDVRGKIYIPKEIPADIPVLFTRNEYAELVSGLPDNFELHIGAFSMKGLGRCVLKRGNDIITNLEDIHYGELNTRIPLKLSRNSGDLGVDVPPLFGLDIHDEKAVLQYGYLYNRWSDRENDGVYVQSIFEGSMVCAPSFLLKS